MNTTEKLKDFIVRLEKPEDDRWVEALGVEAFGPGRFSRSAFRLREGVSSDPALCFVAEANDQIIGSVRLTRIKIGGKNALVLGPLMTSPLYRNFGIGRELMYRSLLTARQNGHRFVVLVGDYTYYRSFGFERVPQGQITFPGPADPSRILACDLVPGNISDYHGETKRDFQAG